MRDAHMKEEGAGIVSVFHDLAEEDLYALIEHGDSTFTPVSGVEIIVPAGSPFSRLTTPVMDRKISTATSSAVSTEVLPAARQENDGLPGINIIPPDAIIDETAGERSRAPSVSFSLQPVSRGRAFTHSSINVSKPASSARSSDWMSNEDLHDALDDSLYRTRRRFVMLSTDKEPMEADSQPAYQHELRRHIRQSLSIAPLDPDLRRRISVVAQKPQNYLSSTTTSATQRKRRVTEHSLGSSTLNSGNASAQPVRKTSRIALFTPSPKPRTRRLGCTNMAFTTDDDDKGIVTQSLTDPSATTLTAVKDEQRVNHRKLTPDYQMTQGVVTLSAAETTTNLRRSASDDYLQLDKQQQAQFSDITEANEDVGSEAVPAPSSDQVELVDVASPPDVRESS